MSSVMFVYEPITKEQEKELCCKMRTAKTEQERRAANIELAYRFERGVYKICRDTLLKIHGKKYLKTEVGEEELQCLMDECFDVLIKKAWDYNPDHSSQANLLSYSRKWIYSALKMKTNPGMTETQINNWCKIYKAMKKYEDIHDSEWKETDESVAEISTLCGLSEKVVRKTIALKQDLSQKVVSLDVYLGDDEEGCTLGQIQEDNRYTYEREAEVKMYRDFIDSLNEEEKAILYTMVDVENNYKPISEREGILLLEEKGIVFKRGTLKARRDALKTKIWAFLHGEDYSEEYSLAA